MRIKREQIGGVVIYRTDNLEPNFIDCANCEKELARIETDGAVPSCQQLLDAGAVAWLDFGWFCSAKCEAAYVLKSGEWLERRAKVEPVVLGVN